MATALQLEANRNNAQHSTGQKTESGKAAAAKNALRYGLASGQLITFWESKEEYDALLADLIEEHQPATTTETLLIHQMAQHHWLAQRAIFLQQRIIKDAEARISLRRPRHPSSGTAAGRERLVMQRRKQPL